MTNEEYNQYADEVKEKWSNTEQFKEYEEKSKNRSNKELQNINDKLMSIFAELGELKHLSVEDEKVQGKIKLLQNFITNNYYECSNEVLNGLGKMYVNDEKFKNNIDKVGGEGTAQFVSQAIAANVSLQVNKECKRCD